MTKAASVLVPASASAVATPVPGASAAIYAGTVRHRRLDRAGHAFSPKLFMAYLDVDALPGSLDPLPLWSARRPAPVRYRRRDFFDGAEGPLGDAVRDLVGRRLGRRPAGRVDLLAHLRTVGWLHNPLAVYYCWAADGVVLDAVVLEVTNTPWGERHWYVFDAAAGETSGETDKEMYVSPFLAMDACYRVTWTPPGSELDLRVEVERSGAVIFDAELRLRREPLDRARALGLFVRYPLPTLRVTAGIYRRALGLFLARLPRYRHPDRQARRADGALEREPDHG